MRIVAYDLETSDLKAMMGRILCASFHEILPPAFVDQLPKKYHPQPYTLRGDDERFRDEDPADDHKLVVAIRDELHKYNCIVTWNGKLFDNRFLNAKLLEYGEAPLSVQFHYDPMWTVRNGLRIGSSKLLNIQKYLNLGEEKTEITWKNWQRAMCFDRDAMDEVVYHCEQDVRVLVEAYWKLLPYAKTWPKG